MLEVNVNEYFDIAELNNLGISYRVGCILCRS